MLLRTLVAAVFVLPLATFAADIKVLAAGATRPPLMPLIENYIRRTHDRIDVTYGTVGLLRQKLAAGERRM